MALLHQFILLLCCTLIFPLINTTPHPNTTSYRSSSKKLVLKLIHHDSIHSPLYNLTHTTTDHATLAFKRSISRFNFLDEKMKSCPIYGPCSSQIEVNLLAQDWVGAFFVKFYIKDTTHPIFLVMDTASSLLWVSCLPCDSCDHAPVPIYDPSASSTYTNVECRSEYCEALNEGRCDSDGNCHFGISYAGADSAYGNLATESFIFYTSDDGLVTVSNVVFGCGHNPLKDKRLLGVLGLNHIKTSFAAQLGGKFSYCVGKVKDRSYEHSHLIFGEGAILQGDSTPIELDLGYYYVALEGISLGEEMLDIPSDTFARTPTRFPFIRGGGAILDSGAEYSSLASKAYKILTGRVRDMMQLKNWFEGCHQILCFEGDATKDTKGFPEFHFHFSGGAQLALDSDALFSQLNSTTFCMTFMLANTRAPNDYSTTGVNAQQYYNMGFDIPGRKVYFQRIDCEILYEE